MAVENIGRFQPTGLVVVMDIALTKRKQLMQSDCSNELCGSLWFTRPMTETTPSLRSTHKVDFVQDNLNHDVLPWDKTGFKWL